MIMYIESRSEVALMQTVLITGTTSGIGYELARVFARKQFNLVLVSRNITKLKAQKRALEDAYQSKVSIYALDLTTEDAAQKVYDQVEEAIDILVNNAGFYEYGNFHEECLDKELEMVQLHNLFLTQLTGLYVRDMVMRGNGKILNVASIAAFSALPYGAVYGATKAYVLSFSKALHVELKQHGIAVSALCPGATNTEFAHKADIESTPLFTGVVMEAKTVAEAAYAGLMKHKMIIIPGTYNRVLYGLTKITPLRLTHAILKKMMRKR